MEKDTKVKCWPCNGLGYHIETCIEADGTRNRIKISCACCDGTGRNIRIIELWQKELNNK